MKIVQFIYSLAQGGAERFLVDLSNELANNHEVIIITIRDDKLKKYSFFNSEISAKVTYINFPLKEGFRFKDFYLIYCLIKKINPDIVHAHLDAVAYLFVPALLLKKTSIFHTIHSDAFFDGKKKILSLFRKYFYKYNKIIPLTISSQSDKSFKEFYKLNNSNLIFNGRKRQDCTEEYQNVKEEISKYKNSSSDHVFIHISRFSEEAKNHSMLLKAFNRLQSEYKNSILLIIGNNFESKEAEFLREMACDKVFFLGNKKNVVDYLLESNAFCLTSKFEGLPISLLEAYSCGVIPICTPAGGIKDLIIDGETGFLSKEISEDSYYEALKNYMNKKEEIPKDKLIKYFQENFSIEICAKNHVNVYQKFLKKT